MHNVSSSYFDAASLTVALLAASLFPPSFGLLGGGGGGGGGLHLAGINFSYSEIHVYRR